MKDQSGFTLIELLVVIGILAILLAITLIAINPTKHFQDTRNAKRSSDVAAILDSIYEYESSNNGAQPPAVTGVSAAVALGAIPSQTATATSFSTPNLTLTVPSGNIITTGTVTITGCSQAADNGAYPVTAGTLTSITVTNATASATSATGCVISAWTGRVDLCANVVPTYLANLPMDPSSADTACAPTYNSGYTIARANGRFTIAAPSAEGGAVISVTR
ncbi:type II secretion system protein [Aeromicrobium sp.]|nr:type II secretion system protein [Candidatus Saccharibacteria bacterium]